MNWFNSIEFLSKALNFVGVFAAILTCSTVGLKFRLDAVKKVADKAKSEERSKIDSDLRAEAIDARAELRATQRHLGPRRLNNAEAAALISLLENVPKEGKVCVTTYDRYTSEGRRDFEAMDFGADISEVLTASGLEVLRAPSDPHSMADPGSAFNVGIVVKRTLPSMGGSSQFPQWVATLEAGLSELGHPLILGMTAANWPHDWIIIEIGKKPPFPPVDPSR